MKQSTILGILSSVGVIGTSVLVGYGTVKAYKKHEIFKETHDRNPTKKEIFIFSVKDFLPAALAGTGTIICILGGTTFNKQTQASIVSAYGLLDRSYKAYRKKIAEKYGKEADIDIYNSIAREYHNVSIPHDESGPGQLLFYDEYSDRWFRRTMLEIADAEYHFNRNLALRGYANLNELYKFLGLEPTEYGEHVGWNLYLGETDYGYQWVDFEHQYCEEPVDEPDSPSFYVLYILQPPHEDYLEEDDYISDPDFG